MTLFWKNLPYFSTQNCKYSNKKCAAAKILLHTRNTQHATKACDVVFPQCQLLCNSLFAAVGMCIYFQNLIAFKRKIKSSLFTERIFIITVGFSILFDYVKYERCVRFFFFHSQNRKQYSFQQEFFLFPYFGTVHHQEAYDDRA